jgi:hypothetical protein
LGIEGGISKRLDDDRQEAAKGGEADAQTAVDEDCNRLLGWRPFKSKTDNRTYQLTKKVNFGVFKQLNQMLGIYFRILHVVGFGCSVLGNFFLSCAETPFNLLGYRRKQPQDHKAISN